MGGNRGLLQLREHRTDTDRWHECWRTPPYGPVSPRCRGLPFRQPQRDVLAVRRRIEEEPSAFVTMRLAPINLSGERVDPFAAVGALGKLECDLRAALMRLLLQRLARIPRADVDGVGFSRLSEDVSGMAPIN